MPADHEHGPVGVAQRLLGDASDQGVLQPGPVLPPLLPAPPLSGEATPQFALEDLACGVARQVFHEEDVLGALEVRQLPSGVLFEFLTPSI